MSLTGKSSLSLRKKDVKEQKNLAIGFKKIVFAHKASAGATGIDLGLLTLPTEMSGVGFTNPTTSELLNAQLFFYRKNLTLVSSLRGVLMDFLSYDVASSARINFNGFTAEEGEIFTGVIDHSARNAVNLVDAAPLVSTGELAIGATDFNVGQAFEVDKYSSQQVGAVVVYRNGVQQFRNTSNSSTNLDGNYYEVNNGSGLGQIIRFNVAPAGQTDSVLVVSNGLLAYNPDGSALQQIETLAGQIDAMVPTLAQLAGVSQTSFQAAPNNVDLKGFGDIVLKLLDAQVTISTDWAPYTPTISNLAVTALNARWRRVGDTMHIRISADPNGSATGVISASIPTGFNIDTSKLPIASASNSNLGTAMAQPTNSGSGSWFLGTITYDSATSVRVFNTAVGTSNQYWDATRPATWAVDGVALALDFIVPIAGWNATQTLRQQLGL